MNKILKQIIPDKTEHSWRCLEVKGTCSSISSLRFGDRGANNFKSAKPKTDSFPAVDCHQAKQQPHHRVVLDFLHVGVSQSLGELVLVDVLVLRDVSEGAVLPRAASGPPEEALFLAQIQSTVAFDGMSHGELSPF